MNVSELDQLRGKLRKVPITVRGSDGAKHIETRDGEVVQALPSQQVLIAAAPDPSVCQITEFLFVGRCLGTTKVAFRTLTISF